MSTEVGRSRPGAGHPPALAHALTAVGVALVALAGLAVAANLVASRVAAQTGHGYTLSIGLGVLWFVVLALAIRVLLARRPQLQRTARLATIGVGVAVAAIGLWSTYHVTTVDETLAHGVPASVAAGSPAGGSAAASGANGAGPGPAAATAAAGAVASPAQAMDVEVASGALRTLDESHASGRVALVRLANGSVVLTLADLDVGGGPDLRVYLVPHPVTRSSDVGDQLDLGALKGARGNQQYTLPAGSDPGRFAAVVIYCRAFAVGFGVASLVPS